MAQYGHRNNLILSSIPDSVSDDTVEKLIDVYVECQSIEAHHRFDKANRQNKKKTNVRFANRKNCEKVLFNKKKSLVKSTTESTVLATVQKYLPVRI